ncbi:MAG: hypothetical protein M3Y54_20545 [Bacteroidota bacterium]|nr:hypothetical protein [Bacteroidota bacterium]
MKFIERLLLVLAWLQIAVSPGIIGGVAGVFIWLMLRGFWGIALGASVSLVGVIIGIAFAEKARRDKGTIEFIARNIAHPELQEKKLTNDPDRTK